MLYSNIIDILENNKFEYNLIDHDISKSCEDSIQFRKELWLIGFNSKNLVFKWKDIFSLVVTSAEKQIRAKNFRGILNTKNIRFANSQEIDLNKLWIIWSIPSFGFDNNIIPICVDSEIFENEYFCFNPWTPDKSIQIKTKDLMVIYKDILKNKVFIFDHKLVDESIIFDIKEL